MVAMLLHDVCSFRYNAIIHGNGDGDVKLCLQATGRHCFDLSKGMQRWANYRTQDYRIQLQITGKIVIELPITNYF